MLATIESHQISCHPVHTKIIKLHAYNIAVNYYSFMVQDSNTLASVSLEVCISRNHVDVFHN